MNEGPEVESIQYSPRPAPVLNATGAKKPKIDETSITIASDLPLAWVNGAPRISADDDFLAAVARRTLDLLFSLIGLLALSPILLGIAIAVRASGPGPILFRQTRIGRNGRPFGIMKFRTLHAAHCSASGLDQVGHDDPRVTSLGHLLRMTRLDELPQLLNILLGDMAVVGPRPHVPDMQVAGMRYDELVSHYHLRHIVKPGLTGWAQVRGYRGAVENRYQARSRVEHDLAYIANRSLGLDLWIIWLTMWLGVARSQRR